ncbi:hypothetical protein NEMBOFW57_005071 [Staphylotrichum longicolle]|uniref:Uncharacterized protein n=1 Tax=Staphylotrichum longicolle TaxID=669026 RepID=A0AAD4EWN0_9PEZI|nr:hypothetical protein NEMBOFW57_005071 [Staphylotrichum longicolle]
MPHQPPTFLTLPLEIRLEIYAELLVLPPPAPVETQQATYRCSYSYSYSSTPTSPTKTHTLARHFSHVDTLTLDLARHLHGRVGADMLRPFEAVPGVRRVRVKGAAGWPGSRGMSPGCGGG